MSEKIQQMIEDSHAEGLFGRPDHAEEMLDKVLGVFYGFLELAGQRACIDWCAANKAAALRMETTHPKFLKAVTDYFNEGKAS